MANTLTASNIEGAVGKWNPYYFKPFLLGVLATGVGSTDGEIYITQTTGSTAVALEGYCNSSHNCDFYYTLTFDNASGTRYFYVTKFDLADNIIDTIFASETGGGDDGKWWAVAGDVVFTIDIGVSIYMPAVGFADNDVYKITLPSRDTMDRRRLYHGGYSSFLRMPETMGKAYHSDIIPTNLKDRNITVLFNLPHGFGGATTGLYPVISKEDTVGNLAVSVALEWNGDKDAATSSLAGSTPALGYGWGSGEKWHLGSIFANDINPGSADTPVLTSFPSSDVTAATETTGTYQHLNTTVSGRSGYARIKTEYTIDTTSPKIIAFNQFWSIILMIS